MRTFFFDDFLNFYFKFFTTIHFLIKQNEPSPEPSPPSTSSGTAGEGIATPSSAGGDWGEGIEHGRKVNFQNNVKSVR